MDRFNALGRGTQLMGIAALLLFIDLFLPWQDFGGEFADELGIDATFSGWRGIGVIVGILTIILLAWVIVRLASVEIPLPVSTAMTAALIGTLVLIFGVIKFLTIIDDEATIWAWVGLVLCILVAVGAFRTVQEAGGVDTLRSEASDLGARTSTPAAPAAPAAEPSAAEPPAAAAPEESPPAQAEPEPEEDRPAT
jgi:hypothetical protein